MRAITGNENPLLLAAQPGDETLACGGFIAESCARGRPPFVAILHDGDEAALRAAMACLRLPADRLLPMGLPISVAPGDTALFSTIVATLATLSWRVDCNLVCAPPSDHAIGAIADAICTAAFLPRLIAAPNDQPSAIRLDVRPHRAARAAALAIYGHAPPAQDWEAYLPMP